MDKVFSAIIYLIVISLATAFTRLAEKSYRTEKKCLVRKKRFVLSRGAICLIVAILIPCILAGIRGDNVGSDVVGYASSIVQETKLVDTFQELNRIDRTYTEIGYRFFAFAVSRVFPGLGWLLFFTELVIMGSMIYALYLFRDEFSMSMGMFFFMTCQYHLSFNAMRQMMAACILLVAFYFLVNHKTIKFVLISLLAMSLHTFSIAIAGIMFVAWKFKGCFDKKWQKYFVILGCFAIAMAWSGISQLLLRFSTGVFYRYARYFTQDFTTTDAKDVITSPVVWISVLIFILCAIPIWNNKKGFKDNYDGVLFILLLLSVFGRFMQIYMTSMNRFCWYLFTFNCFLIPRSLENRSRTLGRKTRAVALVLLMLSYWLVDCMLSGYTSTSVLTFRL